MTGPPPDAELIQLGAGPNPGTIPNSPSTAIQAIIRVVEQTTTVSLRVSQSMCQSQPAAWECSYLSTQQIVR